MLGVLGDEWTLLILQQATLGATRYGQFTARLPISHAVLTRRLAAMTADGLLAKRTYQANPSRADYVLTPRGRALWPVLVSIWEWERHWVPDHAQRLPAMHHTVCGADFAPVLRCAACADSVTEKDIGAQWGPSGGWSRSMPVLSTRRRSSADRVDGRADLFPETMSILGNRWAFALLVAAFVGASRFGDFQDQLGAPPGSLADRLQIFTANGVLAAGDGRYRLTEKGRAVFPILITALQWAQRCFRAPEGPAVELVHTDCGAAFEATLACDQCASPLRGAEVATR
ncbi:MULTISPECIES: winged helix-turn-helix transcriptional regulator [unclassified Mycobacterium]|uniref:winged helix-turn-helix transcriptional regulator n=1 Tax=unclassified Mycobacterium TaxID=2642494 RepID=UPI0029C955AC|nr:MULTISPECIES: winged helix-turn-helix transcriptional regulator [unclassified Mycobacterium]